MSDERRPTAPLDASVDSAEAAALAAYRREEPVRQRDPFHVAALQQLVAEEASARATRQHGGPIAWLARWFRSAPRPALAGAALSLALLVTGVPLGPLQITVESAERSAPNAVMSDLPMGGGIESQTKDQGLPTEAVGIASGAPWLLIAGAVGLTVSLLAAESVRRRRRT